MSENRLLYNVGFCLVVEEENDEVMKNALKRIRAAIYEDPRCKAFVTDRESHKLKEWEDGTI